MLNSLIIVGRIVEKPILSISIAGISYTKIKVDVQRNYSEDVNEGDTFYINMTRRTAERCVVEVSEGDLIFIKGRLFAKKIEPRPLHFYPFDIICEEYKILTHQKP